MMGEYINIHTHKPGTGISIADPCLGPVVLPSGGKVYYSLGIHPLYIDEHTGQRFAGIEAAAAAGNIVAIGEAGLDRNSTVSMEVQQKWFERQANIAMHYDLPVIIHGVRAIPEIITVVKKYSGRQNWIMHGFNNRREILQDLLKHGFYISVGRQMMNPESHAWQLLPEIPDDCLFIETDNSDYSIEEIYGEVAARKRITLEELQQKIALNFYRLFPVKKGCTEF